MPGDVHGDVRRQGPREHPYDADPSDVRVAGRAHHLGHQWRIRVTGHRAGGGPVWLEDLLRRVLRRRREAAHTQVEQLGAAAAVDGTDSEHRVHPRCGHRLLQVADEQLLLDRLALEVALHQQLVLGLLDHSLDEVTATLVGGITVEKRSHATGRGYDDRQHPLTERLPDRPQRPVEVGARVVELAHHDRAWHVDRVALPPQSAGALVDRLVGGHHEQGAVGRAETGTHLTDEVRVAGGVEEVDLAVLVHHGCDGERARPLVCAFDVLEVAHGVVVRDRPGPVDSARGEQQRLDQRGLAGLARADQDDVADLSGRGHLEMVAGDPAAAAIRHGNQPTPIPTQAQDLGRSDRAISGRSARSAGSPSATASRHPSPSRCC